MQQLHQLNGIITALVTPMLADGKIDYTSLDKLIEYQIGSNITGLVVLGTTAEATSLSLIEKITLLEYIINKNNARTLIIVGVYSDNLDNTLIFIDKINHIAGIDYIMIAPPSYIKPTQDGLYQYFMQLANHSNYPVILYNVPSRTGCDLTNQTILSLARDNHNIIGVKDATGNIVRATELIKHKPINFVLLSGDDASFMPAMMCGYNGVISVVSNFAPKIMIKIATQILQKSINQSLVIELNNQLLELYNLCFIETNPIPIKWLLYHINAISTPTMRLPLTTLSTIAQDQLKAAVNNINKI